MKTEVKQQKPDFKPVSLTITFETQRELQGIIQFFGNINGYDFESIINKASIEPNGYGLITDYSIGKDPDFLDIVYNALLDELK